jgi:phosphoserine phosphatase
MSEAATRRVEQLIQLTQSLTALIAAECRAFEARRPQDAARTLEETTRLANIYRHESARIRVDRSLIAGAPAALRNELIRATEAFDAVLARHGRAIDAARTVTEGLVRAVANEVVAQRKTGAGYGPGATAVAASATAITLNKRA